MKDRIATSTVQQYSTQSTDYQGWTQEEMDQHAADHPHDYGQHTAQSKYTHACADTEAEAAYWAQLSSEAEQRRAAYWAAVWERVQP